MASIQSFLRDDPNSHRYVPSPRNQRIEAWWAFLRRSHSTWWINFFKDMVDKRVVDLTSELQMECLWFCFSQLLQKVLDEIREHWNTHRIRRSRHDTINGTSDSLYYLPELHGVTDQFLLPISGPESRYVHAHIIERDSDNYFQDYFSYVSNLCHLGQPSYWKEALDLYNTLLQCAYNGNATWGCNCRIQWKVFLWTGYGTDWYLYLLYLTICKC